MGSHGSLSVAPLCQGQRLEVVDGGAASTMKDRWNKFKRPSGFAQTKQHPEIANASANEVFCFSIFGFVSNCRLSLHMSKPGTFTEPVLSLVESLGTFSVRVCGGESKRTLASGKMWIGPWQIWRMKNIMKVVRNLHATTAASNFATARAWLGAGRPPDQICGPDQIVVNS